MHKSFQAALYHQELGPHHIATLDQQLLFGHYQRFVVRQQQGKFFICKGHNLFYMSAQKRGIFHDVNVQKKYASVCTVFKYNLFQCFFNRFAYSLC
ncbi:hypothetical protein D3C87_1969840 [compost metagenome]